MGDRPDFSIQRVLGDIQRVISGQFWQLLVIVGPLYLVPCMLVGVSDIYTADPDAGWLESIRNQRGGNLIIAFFGLFVVPAVTFLTVRYLQGKPVSPGKALNRGFSLFFAMWGMNILTTLGIILGLVFFVIPGLLCAVLWSVARPIRVMEKGMGVTDAIGASSDLTRGRRWPIFGLLVIFAGTVVLGYVALIGAIYAVSYLAPVYSDWISYVILSPLWVTQYMLTFTIGAAAIYRELRRDREQDEQMAVVFT